MREKVVSLLWIAMIRQIQKAVSLVANIFLIFVIIVWVIIFVLGDESEGCQPPSNGDDPEGANDQIT